ncbi:MAG: hypothetical protein CSA96_00060 [Bacteroidetes bacterium]|nr:MAG: hypothetical protein CSA96_00060 [Bacteroidota bacterium]
MVSRPALISVLFFLLVLLGCSVEKNTSLSRNYHNLTSHYNIYFNGRESYRRGVEKARDGVQFDYNQVLPLFLFADEGVHSTVSSDMKRAIDKATKLITFHSITAKPKLKDGNQNARDKAFFEQNEFNKWVDDSYMLMGRAYMFQGKFFLAAETFKHVLVTYPKAEVRFLGMIWLARATLLIGDTGEAERILSALSDQNNLPREYLLDYLLTWSAFHIQTGSFADAVSYLNQALGEKGLKKKDKIRYLYILGQLQEELGQKDKALQSYRKVTRLNPPYEMAFNARVSMAEVFETGSEDSGELKKLLKRMLKDSKNKEYQDQIYFALANIAREEGDMEEAIRLYQRSVSTSVQNNYQKGLSSATLAGIYYDRPDYMLSAAYYDSAVSFLDDDYPGYKGLTTLSASLSNLVQNVNTCELEDSLQMLAALPEAERLKIVDGIIEDLRIAEEEARQAEQQAIRDMAFNQSMSMTGNMGGMGSRQQQGGQWYFYNPNLKSFGQPEFRMKWGDRKLEDNWRRRNRQSISSLTGGAAGVEGDSAGVDAGKPLFDNKSREFYLVNIPTTDSMLALSNSRLEAALFAMGDIYKNKLLDYDEAIQAFETLLQRFPETEKAAETLYNLYQLYNSTRASGKAELSKTRLVRSYPDSHYAMLLNNPNYLKELEEEEQKVVRAYESVLRHYRAEEHAAVLEESERALQAYSGDALEPKFLYISSLSRGSLYGKEALKQALDTLLVRFPDSEEALAAQEMIEYMYMEFPEIREADQVAEAEALYVDYDPEQPHYFLLALPASANANRASFELLNFNLDRYNPYNLELDKFLADAGQPVIVVKLFNNADGAMRYLASIREQAALIVSDAPPEAIQMMVISRDNLEILNKEKLIQPYYLFFRDHYLTQD